MADAMNRDAKGRFLRGNHHASTGGKARAQTLTDHQRQAIARKGREALVEKHFDGDDLAQRAYMAELGRWAYEQQVTVTTGLGNSVRAATQHPGSISQFRLRRRLMSQLDKDEDFYEGRNASDFVATSVNEKAGN